MEQKLLQSIHSALSLLLQSTKLFQIIHGIQRLKPRITCKSSVYKEQFPQNCLSKRAWSNSQELNMTKHDLQPASFTYI